MSVGGSLAYVGLYKIYAHNIKTGHGLVNYL